MKGTIYKITNPKGRVYIGQTINFKIRIQNYKGLRCKSQIKLYNSFLKYGFESHLIEILKECDKEQLNDLERYYQDFYFAIGKDGLNCILTKTLDRSGEFSDESKLKMSISKKGIKRSKEVCEAISERMKITASNRSEEYYKNFKGKPASEEHRKKNSNAKKGNTFRRGKKQSDESKEKMSIAKKGIKFSEETKEKMKESAINAWKKRKKNE